MTRSGLKSTLYRFEASLNSQYCKSCCSLGVGGSQHIFCEVSEWFFEIIVFNLQQYIPPLIYIAIFKYCPNCQDHLIYDMIYILIFIIISSFLMNNFFPLHLFWVNLRVLHDLDRDHHNFGFCWDKLFFLFSQRSCSQALVRVVTNHADDVGNSKSVWVENIRKKAVMMDAAIIRIRLQSARRCALPAKEGIQKLPPSSSDSNRFQN